MKKVNKCVVENCIPTPSSCTEWNGGDIEFLGICNGDSLNNLVWEIVNKLQAIAGEDLSEFDIDSLLILCQDKAPSEVTLISILNLIRDNQICLKDYINKLEETVAELAKEQDVNVSLKCFAQLDNYGNSLNITRDGLDQLVIDQLCNQKGILDTLSTKYTLLQKQVNELEIPDTTEPSVSTCIDNTSKPASTQLINLADAFCELRTATGTPEDIAVAMAKTPAAWDKFKTLPGWVASPSNEAQWLNNVILVLINTEGRTTFMEENCCAVTCDDIKVDFVVTFSEDGTALVLTFSNATGTKIPSGFVDKGSTGTVTDIKGNKQPFTPKITNNYQIEVPINTLTKGEMTININAKIGNATLVCDKCLNKTVTLSSCGVCELTATGDSGAVAVIVYEDNI